MESIEKRLRDLEKKVAHLEAENKLKTEALRLLRRLVKENHANITEYILNGLDTKGKS